jgi:transposase
MTKKTGKYIVRLTLVEREYLRSLGKKGKVAARRLAHARILLRADVGEDGEFLKDKEIIRLEATSQRTITRVRQLLVEEGLEAALSRKPHSNTKPRKLDGEKEAKLIALCCSEAPEGRSNWTLKLLADKLVELEIVDSIGREAVRQTLKKMNLSLGKKRNIVFHQKPMQTLCAVWKTS